MISFQILLIAAAMTGAGAADPSTDRFASQLGIEWNCSRTAVDSFTARVRPGAPRRVQCLAGAGFLVEADEAATPGSNLKALLSLLREARRSDAGVPAFLEKGMSEGSADAAMWTLIGFPEMPGTVSSRQARRAAVEAFLQKPEWMRERFGRDLAEGLLVHRDTSGALFLAQGIRRRTVEGTRARALALAALVEGLAQEQAGDVGAARRRFADVDGAWDSEILVEARFRTVVLEWRRAEITAEDAVRALDLLYKDHPHGRVGRQVALARARALDFAGRPLAAVTVLGKLHGDAQGATAREIRRRIEDTASRALTTDNIATAEAYLTYRLSRDFLSPAGRPVALDLTAAERFAGAGLFAASREAVSRFGRSPGANIPPQTALRVASVHIAAGSPVRAVPWLAASRGKSPGPQTEQWAGLSVSALDPGKLKSVDATRLPVPAAAVLAQKSWRHGLWPVHQQAVRRAGVTLPPDQQALSDFLGSGSRSAPAMPEASAVARLVAASPAEPTRTASSLRSYLRGADAVIAAGLSLLPPTPKTGDAS